MISWDWYQILVSSAYIEVFEFFIANGKSLMYMKNRSSPRHDPSGTPIVISLIQYHLPDKTVSGWTGRIPTRKPRADERYNVVAFGRECCGQLCQRLLEINEYQTH